ncbi:MAG: MBL fold metallo-hydrolase [Gemmatimonadota bacterium]
MMVLAGSNLQVTTLDAGTLRLDGGAMFGVVPKPLWSRRTSSDELNRIPLAMRCLLVQTSDTTVLVDTGLGNKESQEFHSLYGVENTGKPTKLEDSLRQAGVEPEEVDVVLNTHLHFDHAGGNTRKDPDGRIVPAFPNARYVIRRGEWRYAQSDNPRVRASYFPANFSPLVDAGRVDFLDEDTEVVPGVWAHRAAGHTPHHQVVRIELGGETLLYMADLVPTAAHMPLPWIMGYDVEPLVTLENKREWLGRAAAEGWLLGFEHDPHIAWGRAGVSEAGDGCVLLDAVRDDGLPQLRN